MSTTRLYLDRTSWWTVQIPRLQGKFRYYTWLMWLQLKSSTRWDNANYTLLDTIWDVRKKKPPLSSDVLESVLSSFSSATNIYSPGILLSEYLLPPRQDREFHSQPPGNAVRPTAFTANTDEHNPPVISSSDGSLSPSDSTELIVQKNLCLECTERPQGFFSDHELQRHINRPSERCSNA